MAMKLLKKTADYKVYQRGDNRCAVQDRSGKPVNGEEKVRILLAESLITVVLPSPAAPEVEEAPAEEVVVEEAAAAEAAVEEAPAEEAVVEEAPAEEAAAEEAPAEEAAEAAPAEEAAGEEPA